MKKISEIIKQPEGRRIEFKEELPTNSDIRNAILAPVFKKLGIIEQWGNGLKLISGELNDYPEIELKWTEPGIAFRVSFIKKNYTEQQDSGKTSGKESTTGGLATD